MKTITGIVFGIVSIFASSAADVNITNIVPASGLKPSDTFLAVTNGTHTARPTIQMIIDLAKIQIPGGFGSASNLTPWTSDINAATWSLTNGTTVVSRNVWDIANVLYWGATGNGDNASSAIQAALNSGATKEVYIPKGVAGLYIIDKTIQVPSGMSIRVDPAVILRASAGLNSNLVQNANLNTGNIDIKITGGVWDGLHSANIPGLGCVVAMTNVANVTLQNMIVTNGYYGIILNHSTNSWLINDKAYGNYYGGLYVMDGVEAHVMNGDYSHNLFDTGIDLAHNPDSIVGGNVANYNGSSGISISSLRSIVSGNTCIGNSPNVGINIGHSSTNIWYAHDTIVKGNVVMSNSVGIAVQLYTTNVSVFGNIVRSNTVNYNLDGVEQQLFLNPGGGAPVGIGRVYNNQGFYADSMLNVRGVSRLEALGPFGTPSVRVGNFGQTSSTWDYGLDVSASNYVSLWFKSSQDAGPPTLLLEAGGNVGIGKTNLTAKLDVAGPIHLFSDGANSLIEVTNTSYFLQFIRHNALGDWGLMMGAEPNGPYLYPLGSGGVRIWGTNLTGLTVSKDGSVGIKNENPGFDADVVGAVNCTGGYFLNGVPFGGGGGTATNVMMSSAGPGIAINTNSLLYTFSVAGNLLEWLGLSTNSTVGITVARAIAGWPTQWPMASITNSTWLTPSSPLNATNLAGTIDMARIGYSGTRDATTFLGGDGQYRVAGSAAATNVISIAAGSGIAVNTNGLLDTISVTGNLLKWLGLSTNAPVAITSAYANRANVTSSQGTSVLGLDAAYNFTVTGLTPDMINAQIASANLDKWARLTIDGTTITTNVSGQIQALGGTLVTITNDLNMNDFSVTNVHHVKFDNGATLSDDGVFLHVNQNLWLDKKLYTSNGIVMNYLPSPPQDSTRGAVLFTDGTNLCIVVQGADLVVHTNRLTQTPY